VAFLALAGLAVLRRLHGRRDEAASAGAEAIELHLAGGPRRLANRVDPQADVLSAAAACCVVLGGLAAEAGRGEQAARLLGHADRLQTDARTPVPAVQLDDLDRTRTAAVALLGPDAFMTEFGLGQRGRLGHEVSFGL
jgi:hypothetical protein